MARAVPLTRGYVAIVDDEDFARVSAKKWSSSGDRGAARAQHYWRDGGKVRAVGLGRFILDAPAGMHVDHINGDPLDNRRANLRLCTHAENMRNRRKHRGFANPYKGVLAQSGRFYARICSGGRYYPLGGFAAAEEAARAYDAAARRLHGEFARLNFPDELEARQ